MIVESFEQSADQAFTFQYGSTQIDQQTQAHCNFIDLHSNMDLLKC